MAELVVLPVMIHLIQLHQFGTSRHRPLLQRFVMGSQGMNGYQKSLGGESERSKEKHYHLAP